jgi:hypothetical protein
MPAGCATFADGSIGEAAHHSSPNDMGVTHGCQNLSGVSANPARRA